MARLGGDLQVSPQELMTDSSIQMATLGARATTGDGREFRYVKAGGTALVPGKLQQTAAETTAWENLSVAAAAIGDKSITTTSTVTVTANQLAGGYVAVSVTPGQGYMYRIRSHAAATAAVVTLYLEDPIQVALTTASYVDLISSPYAEVIINPSSATGTPIGVAVYPITAEYYGWIQTKGPANVLADGAITVGTNLVASNGTAGAVEPLAGVQASIGIAMEGISTTEYGMVYLNLP